MSQAALDAIGSGFAAWEQGGVEALLPHLTDDVAWTVRADLPDAGTYHGHDGVRRLLARFEEVLEDMRFEPLEFIQAGERIVVPLQWSARGTMSGAVVAERQGETWVFTVRGAQVSEIHEYPTKEQALAAVEHAGPPVD
jgi:ketosteroid isomerase-like protein